MLLKKKVWKIAFLVAMPILGLMTGCAPTVYLSVERPPTLNTAGIKRIAVMPFEGDGRGSRDAAAHATNVATQNVRAMNHFTLVSADEVARLRRSGGLEDYVDALLEGRVTRVASDQRAERGSYKNREGQTVHFTNFITEAEVELQYSLMRIRDKSLVGPVSKRGSARNSNQQGYVAREGIIRQSVERALTGIGRDLAPHHVRESRTFASEKINKSIQPDMKTALNMVKAKSYKQALDAYIRIYEQSQSAAAAINASILHEVMGDREAAIVLLQAAHEATGNPDVQRRLNQLGTIERNLEVVATQYRGEQTGGTAAERVANHAVSEIEGILAEGAKIWIYNDAQRSDVVEAVADNISAALIRKGVDLVDRENADLVQAEQEFHMSGNVNDNDIVSAGNAAGANVIVVIGLTGQGANRRLQLRVLDIETQRRIFQSDTSERWQL